MKGIILAGGTGSRLYPLTKVTNKHLLPVYDKPMIFYPIQTLIDAGIKEILIVSGRGHAGHFLELLGSGADIGVKFTYEIQEEAGGIAQALGLAESFADEDDVTLHEILLVGQECPTYWSSSCRSRTLARNTSRSIAFSSWAALS